VSESRAYGSFEGFLTDVIRDYWESPKRTRVGFLALLLASREAWTVALERASAPGTSKKLLGGAAGATALALLLRTVVGGPLGLVLGGASIASLVAVYVKQHERIWTEVEHTRALVDGYEAKWRAARTNRDDGKLEAEHFELVVDGLEARMLRELLAGTPPDPEETD